MQLVFEYVRLKINGIALFFAKSDFYYRILLLMLISTNISFYIYNRFTMITMFLYKKLLVSTNIILLILQFFQYRQKNKYQK